MKDVAFVGASRLLKLLPYVTNNIVTKEILTAIISNDPRDYNAIPGYITAVSGDAYDMLTYDDNKIAPWVVNKISANVINDLIGDYTFNEIKEMNDDELYNLYSDFINYSDFFINQEI